MARKGDTRWHRDDERTIDRGGRTCPTCGGAGRVIREREAVYLGHEDNPGDINDRISDSEYKICPECKAKGTI